MFWKKKLQQTLTFYAALKVRIFIRSTQSSYAMVLSIIVWEWQNLLHQYLISNKMSPDTFWTFIYSLPLEYSTCWVEWAFLYPQSCRTIHRHWRTKCTEYILIYNFVVDFLLGEIIMYPLENENDSAMIHIPEIRIGFRLIRSQHIHICRKEPIQY